MASIQQESCSAAAGAAPAFTNSSTSRHGPSSWPSVPNNTPLHPHQDKAKTSATNYKQASSRNKLATESLSSFPMPVNTATSHRQNHARRRRPPPQRISVHPRDRSTAPAVKPFKSASLPPESTSATSFGKDLAVAVQQPVQAVLTSGSALHDGGHHQYYNKDGQQQQPLSAAIRQSYATENQYSFKQEGKSRHQHHRQHHSLPRQLFKTQQSREADKPKKSATWSAMPTNAISSATSTPTVTTATTIAVESLSCLMDASEGKERSSSPPSSESDFVDSLFAMAGLVDTPSDQSSSISCSPKKSGTTQATPSTSCSGSTTGPTVPVDDFYWAGDGLFSLPTPAQPSSATSSNSPGDAQMQHSKAFGRWFTAISEETGESGEAQTTDLPSSVMSNSDGDNLWHSTERSKESETIDSTSPQTKSPPDQSDTLPFLSPTKQQVASISTSATTITSTPSVSKVVTPPPGFNARTIATQEHTAPLPDESLSTNTKQPVPIASPSWEEARLSSTIPTTNIPSTINPAATPNNTTDVAATTTTAVTNGTAGLLDQLQPDHPAQSVEDDNRVSKVTVAPVKKPKNASNRKRRSLKSYLPASKPLTNPLISTNPVAPSSRPPGPPSQFLTNSSSITSASSSSAPASSTAVSSTGSGRNKRGGANTNTSNNQNGTRGGGSSGSIPYPPPHPLTHPHLLLFNQAAVHAHSATFALHAAASLPSVYLHHPHQQQSQHGSRPPHPAAAAAYLSQNPYFSQNLYAAAAVAAASGSGYLTHPHHHHPHHVPHPHSHPHHLHPFNGYNSAYSMAGAAATASPYSHSNAGAATTDNNTSTVGASTKQVPASNGGRSFTAPKKGPSSSSSYGHHHQPAHAHHQQQHSQHKQAH